jgi:hypothetical protein
MQMLGSQQIPPPCPQKAAKPMLPTDAEFHASMVPAQCALASPHLQNLAESQTHLPYNTAVMTEGTPPSGDLA